MENYKDTLEFIYKQAKRKGACELFPHFNGGESVEHLAKLMFTPEGAEFCIDNRFPDIATLRTFKPYNPRQYGVYIDDGEVEINNRDCYIIGDTNATVQLSEVKGFDVYLMHGAKAEIIAKEYAVVRVIADSKSSYTIKKYDNAIVVC